MLDERTRNEFVRKPVRRRSQNGQGLKNCGTIGRLANIQKRNKNVEEMMRFDRRLQRVDIANRMRRRVALDKPRDADSQRRNVEERKMTGDDREDFVDVGGAVKGRRVRQAKAGACKFVRSQERTESCCCVERRSLTQISHEIPDPATPSIYVRSGKNTGRIEYRLEMAKTLLIRRYNGPYRSDVCGIPLKSR